MENMNCLVTGADSGLGYAFASGLACEGATVIMLCQDGKGAKEARIRLIAESKNPNIDLISTDLTSLEKMRQAAEEVNLYYQKLHILANLEYCWFPRHARTSEGIERNFAANVLGPFLLTNLLWQKMADTEGARILTLSSESHRTGLIRFDDPGLIYGYSPLEANRQAALARVLWTYELARRSGHTSLSCNVVATDWYNPDKLRHFPRFLQWPVRLLNRLRHKTVRQATEPLLHLALDESHSRDNGVYFLDGKRELSVPITYSKDYANHLWSMCQKLTKSTIPARQELVEDFIPGKI